MTERRGPSFEQLLDESFDFERGARAEVRGAVHPIEAESYRLLEARVDLSAWPPGPRAVVARVIHATADLDFAATLVVDEAAAAAGIEALRAGAPVIADVEMTRAAISGVNAFCYLSQLERQQMSGDARLDPGGVGRGLAARGHTGGDATDAATHERGRAPGEDQGVTRSAAAIRLAAERHPRGAIFVVGCAPTALAELVRLAATGAVSPALVIGLPVGFVGAAEAKEALRASRLPAVSNAGEKGGSAAAGAALNALARLANAFAPPRPEASAGAPPPSTSDRS